MKIDSSKEKIFKNILVYLKDPRVRFIIVGLQTEECTVELSETSLLINKKEKDFKIWFDKFISKICSIYEEYYKLPNEEEQNWYLRVTYYG